jgi:hypothetical protein
MHMIYMLMLLVGANTSLIQNSFADNQLEMAQVAQNASNATHTATTQYLAKLDAYNAQLAASKPGLFGEIAKWVTAAVGIVLGAALAETAVGFAIIAAVIAFTQSPFFDKTVSLLGGAIGNMIGDSAAGKVIAQAMIVMIAVALTKGCDTYTTATVFTQTLLASNLVGEAAQAAFGDTLFAQILSLTCSIAIMLASFKCASGSNAMSALSTGAQVGVGLFAGAAQLANAGAEGESSYHTYEAGEALSGLAPLQASVMEGQGLSQVLNQITNLSQQSYKSIMESNRILFDTDFASDWKSCVDAQRA